MATYTKYNQFVEDLANKVHDLMGTAGSGADTCKVLLSNTAPNVATHATRADAAEISAGNGYTSGGASIANVGSRSGAVFTIVATDLAGGSAHRVLRLRQFDHVGGHGDLHRGLRRVPRDAYLTDHGDDRRCAG